MPRHPITVRRRRKASRAKRARRAERDSGPMVGIYNPAAGQVGRVPVDQVRLRGLSKTQAKRVAAREKAANDKAVQKLKDLDSRWGVGLGPVKARLKWMGQLFGGG